MSHCLTIPNQNTLLSLPPRGAHRTYTDRSEIVRFNHPVMQRDMIPEPCSRCSVPLVFHVFKGLLFVSAGSAEDY